MEYRKRWRTLVFMDLDDTLFQTQRKNRDARHPATVSPDPSTVSYMSDAQAEMLGLWKSGTDCGLVPVTARDSQQYYRTHVSKDPSVVCASLYFGGSILVADGRDPVWESTVRASMKESGIDIRGLAADVGRVLDPSVFRTCDVDGYYVTVKCRDRSAYIGPMAECSQTLQEIIPAGIRMHANDNNIALYPACIDKRHAVAHIIDRFSPILTIGIGDSLSDWGFMDLCHYRMFPGNSQLDRHISQHTITGHG